MILNAMYFGKSEIYDVIRKVGGTWNDNKERPIVCLLRVDNTNVYWAIPVGNWNHRDSAAKERIESFLNRPENDISSCFYHVGNTTTKSIFFISDVIPITDKYIDREYLGWNNNVYIIKNTKLLNELMRKLKRIIYYEDKNPNYFRQHITDVKKYLLNELK
jgi:hypothetical protein